MNLTELLKKAAIRGGIQITDEAFTTFLATLPEALEVPDTIATGINSLMSEADAKLNPEVKKHFYRSALDPVDTKLAEIAAEFGLSAEQVEALKGEKNTYEKPNILKNAIADLLKSNGKTTDSPEAKKQIEELTEALKKVNEEKEATISKLTSEFETERVNNAVMAQFGNYQWSEAYAPTLRPTVINAVLQQELAAAGAKIKRNSNGEIELVNANDETLPYRQNNEPVAFSQFADGLMAKHNLIKTAATSTGQATSTTTTAAASAPATQSNLVNRLVQQNESLLQSASSKN